MSQGTRAAEKEATGVTRSEDDAGVEGDRNFVIAVARGLDVLRAFRVSETDLTNQDIARRTGLPKPTISRLTYTLCKLGYLVHSEAAGTYRLGAGVLTLGYGVLAGLDIGELAREEMHRLCDVPGTYVTAGLGERHRRQAVYLSVHRTTQAVSLAMNVGSRLPLFHSAMGRAILVAMPADDRARMMRIAIEERPEDEARIRQGLERAVDDYGRYGLTRSFGDWQEEVNGIAVPIVSLSGDRLFALNVGGPSFLVSPDVLMDQFAERLIAAGRRLSREG